MRVNIQIEIMKDFFEAIAAFHQDVLFQPLNALRELQDESWFAANIFNWLFILIGFVALAYWLKQLKMYSDNNDDRQDVTAHSILGKDS